MPSNDNDDNDDDDDNYDKDDDDDDDGDDDDDDCFKNCSKNDHNFEILKNLLSKLTKYRLYMLTMISKFEKEKIPSLNTPDIGLGGSRWLPQVTGQRQVICEACSRSCFPLDRADSCNTQH